MDRARRSISVEARQANLIDQIAQFNEMPKKYEIKFDLTGLQLPPAGGSNDKNDSNDRSSVKDDENDQSGSKNAAVAAAENDEYDATLSELECAPMTGSGEEVVVEKD
mgnify:CR=1 FL=1